MTEPTIALREYLRKMGMDWDSDLLREGIRVLMRLLMEAEVSEQIGAERYQRREDRQNYRTGYREREWRTRVGAITLQIPKLREGTYYPSFLQARAGSTAGASGIRPVRRRSAPRGRWPTHAR
jgi:transposase-like protein